MKEWGIALTLWNKDSTHLKQIYKIKKKIGNIFNLSKLSYQPHFDIQREESSSESKSGNNKLFVPKGRGKYGKLENNKKKFIIGRGRSKSVDERKIALKINPRLKNLIAPRLNTKGSLFTTSHSVYEGSKNSHAQILKNDSIDNNSISTTEVIESESEVDSEESEKEGSNPLHKKKQQKLVTFSNDLKTIDSAPKKSSPTTSPSSKNQNLPESDPPTNFSSLLYKNESEKVIINDEDDFFTPSDEPPSNPIESNSHQNPQQPSKQFFPIKQKTTNSPKYHLTFKNKKQQKKNNSSPNQQSSPPHKKNLQTQQNQEENNVEHKLLTIKPPSQNLSRRIENAIEKNRNDPSQENKQITSDKKKGGSPRNQINLEEEKDEESNNDNNEEIIEESNQYNSKPKSSPQTNSHSTPNNPQSNPPVVKNDSNSLQYFHFFFILISIAILFISLLFK